MSRRSPSSSRWLQRQAGDVFVKQSREQGYRSRAAFKLLEINRRYRLLRPGARVLDLGASPGGWTQVACAAVGPRGTVVALDVLDMAPVAGARMVVGDCRDPAVQEAVATLLEGGTVDVVISDMAPNISGVAVRDAAAQEELADMCLELAARHLAPGGALVMKLFEFAGTEDLIRRLRRSFTKVARRKPGRPGESREFYVVAQGFRAALRP